METDIAKWLTFAARKANSGTETGQNVETSAANYEYWKGAELFFFLIEKTKKVQWWGQKINKMNN